MDTSLLEKMPLFKEMNEKEISSLLQSLDARKKSYKKNDIILHAGSKPGVIGIVLSGSVTILSDDVWGNRTILSHIEKGGIFAEAYAVLKDVPMLVDVMANDDCSILMLKTKGILNSSKSQDSRDYKFLRNLLLISSMKNLNLSGRSFHTSPKTIRERVMSYLNTIALQNDSTEFDIPFDRQQLADYLNLERSALSKELGKMQKDGLIQTKKCHFKLLSPS
ncbi:cAMP-binding domain of CRP or a regulatory subunit of cAMP-dependent protein kinases [Lachnospiraceae bacterium]|nr:cAMP-binding domain of CRP or a regulatory subunit of cAMP-dependent protein kinases [Lachnospiraceae bacterium]